MLLYSQQIKQRTTARGGEREEKTMVTIKKVNEQLEKKNNVNKVWIKENGDLVIHTSGAAMPAGIYNNPDDYCEVTDVYFDWTSGADGKYNTARIMASAANDFYNK
jgi:hypothetical protein